MLLMFFQDFFCAASDILKTHKKVIWSILSPSKRIFVPKLFDLHLKLIKLLFHTVLIEGFE